MYRTAFHLEHCKMPGHMIGAYQLCFEDVFATCQQCCTYALLSSRISGLCGGAHYVVPCLPCGTMWLLCGSPLCGPPPPPPVNLHLNVSQAFVLDRPPPPSVYWSRFFDNFPGLSNIWGSAGPPRVLMTMVPWFELSCESVLWVWEQTVGFVTAKWLYLRCWPSSPLRLGTILTSTQLIPGSQNMGGRPHNWLKIRNAFKLTYWGSLLPIWTMILDFWEMVQNIINIISSIKLIKAKIFIMNVTTFILVIVAPRVAAIFHDNCPTRQIRQKIPLFPLLSATTTTITITVRLPLKCITCSFQT